MGKQEMAAAEKPARLELKADAKSVLLKNMQTGRQFVMPIDGIQALCHVDMKNKTLMFLQNEYAIVEGKERFPEGIQVL